MKENILQALFATVCGAIVAYLNILLVPFAVMIAVMIIDYITGMAQAYISHTLNSRVGVTGIIKKVGYIVAVAVGIVADYLISSALVNSGIDLQINYCIGMIVTIWFIINELISILENLSEIGIPLPKTVLLPSYERPTNTSETSFRNLKFPHDWDYIFDYVGFPAYMKPHDGGGWRNVYRVESPEDMWAKHAETEQLVMMVQEEIVFEDYYRVYCLGRKYVHIMPYEPRNPHHLRYATTHQTEGAAREKLLKTITDYTLKMNEALGYDFNTVEFAVRDGIPYAIDFCNPAPDADKNSVGEENFAWIVEHSAKLAIEKAKDYKPGKVNINWGKFVTNKL